MSDALRDEEPKCSDLSTDEITLFEDNFEEQLFPSKSNIPASPQLAWAEVNALALPFAVLNENEARHSTGHELIKIEKQNGKQMAISWSVWPHPRLGMPTITSLRLLFVLMQKAADAKQEFGYVPAKLKIGTLSKLCEALGMPADGYSRKTIKKHLQILVTTQCMSKGAFKNKKREGLFIDSFKYLRSVGFIGEVDEQGKVIEDNFVVFDEPVRKNLDEKYVKQIDLQLMREIGCPIGQLLYTKLSHLFNDSQGRPVTVSYQWLAETMGIKTYQRLGDARQQLKLAIEALISTSYVESVQWSEIDKLIFKPGIRYSFGEVIPRKDRKAAVRTKSIRSITMQPPGITTKEPIDALLPICSVYSKSGWTAAEPHAHRKGLTESDLRRETKNRGLPLRD